MPKPESPRIDALEALLAERRKHEGYLAKLEERRAATPAHVYTRLRDEYVTKLTDLAVRAAAEAEAIASSIESDGAVVAEIESRLALVLEERIEGELRAEVGEYEPKEWSKKLTVLNATIAQLEKERDARSGSFERTRSLLAEAASGVTTRSSAPSAVVGAEVKVDPAAPGTAPAASVPNAPAPAKSAAPMAGGPSFDELAFLNSVVGRVSTPVPVNPAPPPPRIPTPAKPSVEAAPPAPAPAAPAAAAAAAAPPDAPPVAEVAATAGASGAAAPVAPASPEREPATGASGEPAAAPARDPAPAPRASASMPRPNEPSFSAPPASMDDEPPSPLGRPTPRTSQAIKTLKCQECGTLNYPTEWYCERCGGELAAL